MKTVILEFGERHTPTLRSVKTERPVTIQMGEDCGTVVAKIVNDLGQVERCEVFPPTTTHNDIVRYYIFDLPLITPSYSFT